MNSTFNFIANLVPCTELHQARKMHFHRTFTAYGWFHGWGRIQAWSQMIMTLQIVWLKNLLRHT